jgi:SAM-dependent methyltransferase
MNPLKPDRLPMLIKPMKGDARDESAIREHYLIERELADRLRAATREQRTQLYGQVYDELFRRVPLHPQLTKKRDSSDLRRSLVWQWEFLRRFLDESSTFLEIGAGDCALSLLVCRHVAKVYAADVSAVISENANPPANYSFLLLTDTRLPLPAGSVDVVYSNQLIEHLHPEDALDHLAEIYRVLRPGGVYVCVTPNRAAGPEDVSMYFDQEATGFHMKEYTTGELAGIFRKCGFRHTQSYAGGRGWFVRCPAWPIMALEAMLLSLPYTWRFRLSHSLPARFWLGIRIAGVK